MVTSVTFAPAFDNNLGIRYLLYRRTMQKVQMIQHRCIERLGRLGLTLPEPTISSNHLPKLQI